MVSIVEEIPNLVNGVSQQAPSIRLPSQAETQLNGYSKIGSGLKKRPPLDYVKKLFDNSDELSYIHTIDRDATERYKVFITSAQFDSSFSTSFSRPDFRIFDMTTGVEQTISGFDADDSYFQSFNPRDEFVLLTVADFTFILNKTITVTKLAATSPNRDPEAIVFLKAPTANTVLNVFVDGTQAGDASSASSATLVDTWNTEMTTRIGNEYNLVHFQSSNIWVSRKNGEDFSFHATGPEANVRAFKGTSSDLGSLPQTTKDGYTVEIVGDTGSDADNYWVRHINANDATTGKWEETVKPGLPNRLNPNTLPLQLVRNPSEMFSAEFSEQFGTPNFSLTQIEWTERAVGDITTNPDPSFVGQTLNDLFFYKNRLGLLAGENLILSELGDFFNFYFTTMTTLPDTDPIDLAAPSNRVSILKSAVPFDGGLLLFSDNSQFSLQEASTTGLTPATARLDEISQYKHEPTTKPILAGRKVYYGENRDGFSSIREFGLIEDLQEETAEDITAHVPFYIDGTIRRIFSSIADNVLFVQSTEALNELAVYTFIWERGQKIVSSWSKWTLPADEAWLEVSIIDSIAAFTIKKDNGIHLLTLSLQDGNLFDESGSTTALGFKPMLDYGSSILGIYDSVADKTRWSVPYKNADTSGIYAFGWDELAGTTVDGLTIVAGIIDSWEDSFADDFGGSFLNTGEYTSIEKDGEHTTAPIILGRNYQLTYEFSEPHIRSETSTGVQKVEGDRLSVRDFSVRYEDTAEFILRVEATGRDSIDYEFNARILGASDNVLGSGVVFNSGQFRKLIMSRNEGLKISIIQNAPFPCTFLSAFWSGDFFSRGQSRRAR